MASNIYLKDDILNVLRATYAASEGAVALVAEMLQDPDLCDVPLAKLLLVYRRGFYTAIGSVGLAFGIDALSNRAGERGGLLSEGSTAAHVLPWPVQDELVHE